MFSDMALELGPVSQGGVHLHWVLQFCPDGGRGCRASSQGVMASTLRCHGRCLAAWPVGCTLVHTDLLCLGESIFWDNVTCLVGPLRLSPKSMRKKTWLQVFAVAKWLCQEMFWEDREEVNSNNVRQQGQICMTQPYGYWTMTVKWLSVGGWRGLGWLEVSCSGGEHSSLGGRDCMRCPPPPQLTSKGCPLAAAIAWCS